MSSYRDNSAYRDSYSRTHGSRSTYDGRDRRGDRPQIDSYRPGSSVPRPLGIKPLPGSTASSSSNLDVSDAEGRSFSTSLQNLHESSDRRRNRDDDNYSYSSRRRYRDDDRADTDRRSLKGDSSSYGTIATDKEHHLRRHPQDERRRDLDVIDANDAATPLASGSSEQQLTPTQIVEEFKKRGHFDTVRKQFLNQFQTSEHKQTYLEQVQKFLMTGLQGLSEGSRQRLAAKDQRLQISELSRWIDDSKEATVAFREVFSIMSGINRPQEDGHGDTIFDSKGGIGHEIEVRLGEVISAERQRLRGGATEDMESDDEQDDEEGSSNVTTPMVKSSATPLGRDTPHDMQSRAGSVGSRTPLTGAAAK